MPVCLRESTGGKILAVKASGKLTTQDYEAFVPEVERLVKQHGKIRILFELHDFHGWTLAAAWEDAKFGWEHFSDIERIALVGHSKWEAGMALFCKPFTRATVRYFDEAKINEALSWIHESVTQPG